MDEMSDCVYILAALPREENPVPAQHESGLVPEPLRPLQRREMSLILEEDRITALQFTQ
jgi:hypothetical protein